MIKVMISEYKSKIFLAIIHNRIAGNLLVGWTVFTYQAG